MNTSNVGQNSSWSLFCVRSDNKIDGLTFTQANLIARSLLPSDLIYWLAWHEGATTWMSITYYPELFNEDETILHLVPPVSKKPESIEKKMTGTHELATDELTANLELETHQKVDLRMHRRIQKRFEVEIPTARGMYKTHSVDVSLGGLKLAEALPMHIKSPFIVTLKYSDNELVVECAIILEANGKSSSRLKILSNPGENLYRSWLLN